jgi:methanogenic corrinoid protein MtbC1
VRKDQEAPEEVEEEAVEAEEAVVAEEGIMNKLGITFLDTEEEMKAKLLNLNNNNQKKPLKLPKNKLRLVMIFLADL